MIIRAILKKPKQNVAKTSIHFNHSFYCYYKLLC